MKFVLTMIMCTSVYNMCLEPFPMPTKYNSHYECMIAGYEESIKKAKEIGREEINKYGTNIKFFCMQEKDLPKQGLLTKKFDNMAKLW